MRSMITLALITLMLWGCQSNTQKEEVSSAKRTPSRSLAIVPALDHTNADLSWSLSEEITRSLCAKISGREQLAVERATPCKKDPFGTETQWIKKAYPGKNFVAFTELLSHEEQEGELKMTVKVRLFDLRKEPRVILQEIIHRSHALPKAFSKEAFHQVPWGSEMFELSPLGMAHAQLTSELASRLQDYTLLAL